MIDVAGKKSPDKSGVRRMSDTGRILTPTEQHALGASLSRRSGNQSAKELRWKAKQDAIEAVLPDLKSNKPIRGSGRTRAFTIARWLLIVAAPTVALAILYLVFSGR